MIIKKIEERMNLSLGSYSKELSTIRTGRANPKMLDGVRVEVYGQKMPISQLATVSVPESQMINVQVWDKANVGAVDQAIIKNCHSKAYRGKKKRINKSSKNYS
jgi:ribosome recycling factor